MKTVKLILSYVACGFNILIGLVFAFVEIRPVFAGDFKLMENPATSVVTYLFRFIFFLLVITNAVLVIILKAKKEKSDLYGLLFNASIVTIGLLSIIFYDWYISVLLVVLTVLLLVIRLLAKEEKDLKSVS